MKHGGTGAHLSVDLDETLLEDGSDLATGEGKLQAVAEEDDHRQALAKLVGSRRRARGL